jgi:hypothetical protein
MPTSLAPTLLLSMPQLMDPNFNRTVVLLCTHSEEEGAFGLVLNRPLVTNGHRRELDPPVTTDKDPMGGRAGRAASKLDPAEGAGEDSEDVPTRRPLPSTLPHRCGACLS